MLQKDKTVCYIFDLITNSLFFLQPKLFRNTSGSIIRSKSVEQPIPTWFQEARHRERIEGTNVAGIVDDIGTDNWRRYAREKTKTVSVALVLCLNIGVDPPDVTKPTPCAKLEAWIDPSSTQAQKAIDKIAVALETQYQRWQPRARYKTAADPTVDEVKKLCCSMRRNAKDERVLFHYNGHGVPKPTDNGEIWVFNKNFTQV
jgi:regulator-associated protein of mTOR